MGVDGYLFAEKARRCVYIDRISNVPLNDPLVARHRDRHGGVSEPGVWVAVTIARTRQLEVECSPSSFSTKAMLFLEAFPGDRYFVVSDHETPDCYDVIRDGGYQSWGDE